MSQSSLTLTSTPPDPTSLPTLAAHQSSTPASFSEEVLHFYTTGAKLSLASDQKFLLPAWFPDATSNDISVDASTTEANSSSKTVDEEADDDEDWEDEPAGTIIEDVHLDDITIMASTKNLTFFSPLYSKGYTLSYPSISLHAITSTPTTSGIYMQINPHTSTFDDHDYTSLELTVYPPQTTLTTSSSEGKAGVTSSTQELFDALTECGNLWPDKKGGFFSEGGAEDDDEDDEGDGEGGDGIIYLDHSKLGGGAGDGISFIGGADEVGGIPAMAPGGWITAENVDRIQWNIEGQTGVGDPNNAQPGLGPGAGSVRQRDDEEDASAPAQNGGEEAKWRRTD